MATTVDERIVEARFDSGQFEKGVDKTVKKLDELKKALHIESSGKNITEFTQTASDSLEKMGNTLNKLSTRLTSFTGMIKQQLLGGLAQQVSNVFFKIENSITGFIRSISTDQIGVGMNKYTEILTAVRTMTAAGINESVAYDNIKRLSEYSDQTSYSLNQMASGMSKLVAAGMDVNKAEKSMEGLANMCAVAGVNIYEAQQAFTNFSQAYSSGSMRVQDWQSFERLNMATEGIMKVFMEAGVEAKSLVRIVDKSGKAVYKTVNTTNKQIKAGKEVAVSGFRNTLSYGWLDKKTMEYATSVLAYCEDLGIAVEDLTDEQLQEFSTKAFLAAKEARSFADVMGTIKDVVATGWATSFELIFGKLEEATKFFTWLSESAFADIIYSVGEFRNAILTAWGGDIVEDENALYLKNQNGRYQMMKALENINALVGAIHDALSTLFPDQFSKELHRNLSFAQQIGKAFAEFSTKIREASDVFLNFFTNKVFTGNYDEEDQPIYEYILKDEYVERFQKIADGIKSVVEIIGKVLGIAFRTVEKIYYKLQPIFDGVADAVGKFLDPLNTLNNEGGDFFNNIEHAVDNFLAVLDPFIEPAKQFISFLGDVAAFFLDMSISSITTTVELIADALGLLLEIFGGTSSQKSKEGVGVIEDWTNKIKEFGEICKTAFKAVKDFFTALFNDIRNFLGIGKDAGSKEGGFLENVAKFFETNEFLQKVKAWIDQAIKDIGAWILDIPNKINGFAIKIGDFFHGLFYTKDENGKEIETPFKQWLNQLIPNILEWLKGLPAKIGTAIQKFMINVGDFFHGLFYVKAENGKEVDSQLKIWLTNAANSFIDFVKDLPNKIWTGIQNIGIAIGDFFHNLFYTKDDDGKEVETPFKQWLNQTLTNIIEWIKALPGNIITGIENFAIAVGDFFHGLFYTKDDNGKEVETPFKQWLNQTIQNIKEWLKTLPSKIATGIKKLGSIVGKIAGKIWGVIDEFLFGKKIKKTKMVNGKEVEYTERAKSRFVEIVEGIYNAAKDWIKSIPSKIENLWGTIYEFLFGGSDDPGLFKNLGLDGVGDFLRSVFDNIASVYNWAKSLPFWDELSGWFSNIWKFFTEVKPEYGGKTGFINWITWLKNEIDQTFTDISEWDIWNILGDWFGNIVSFFTEVKPEYGQKSGFVNWLEWIKSEIETWYGTIEDWDIWNTIGDFFGNIWKFFTEKTPENGDETGFTNWLNWIKGQIETIFADITSSDIWKTLSGFFTSIWNWFTVPESDSKKVSNILFDPIGEMYSRIKDGPSNADPGKTGFVKWFEGVKASIDNLFGDISQWGIWKTLGDFFTSIYNWFAEPIAEYNGDTGFIKWFKGLKADLENLFGDISKWGIWQTLGDFFTSIWNWFTVPESDSKKVSNILFDPIGEMYSRIKDGPSNADPGKTGFVKWFEGVKASIDNLFGDISQWGIWKTLGDFFTSIYNWFAEPIAEYNGDTGFIKWFKQLKADLENIFSSISNWGIWQTIGDFFTSIWNWFTMPIPESEIQDTGNVLSDFFGNVTHIKMLQPDLVNGLNRLRKILKKSGKMLKAGAFGKP